MNRSRDVTDIALLDAFDAVPRERFMPADREAFAYIDQPQAPTAWGWSI
jgi:protein-L-isoaspartate(D-aspartate) O-methyltransferase